MPRFIAIHKIVEQCPLCGLEHEYDVLPYNSSIDQKVKPTSNVVRTYTRDLICPTTQKQYSYEFVWIPNNAIQE